MGARTLDGGLEQRSERSANGSVEDTLSIVDIVELLISKITTNFF